MRLDRETSWLATTSLTRYAQMNDVNARTELFDHASRKTDETSV